MPIITAFQGTITLQGNIRGGDEANKLLYKETVKAYGETIGELLDNLVEASVTLANDLFSWVTLNCHEDYNLRDDYWYISMAHPEVLEIMTSDTGSGSHLESVEGVVRYVALMRDIHVGFTISSLLLENSAKSEIIDKAVAPYDGIYGVTSFKEMTKFGFTGSELDTILEIGEREGRIKKFRDGLNLAHSYRKQTAQNATKTNWWKKLVA